MTDEQRKKFYRKVKHLMIDTGVTQQEIAEAAGTSEKFVSKVVTGCKNPTANILIAMSDKFGVTIDELIR